jgi:FtsP/CotA-like multicopper oxidase with cupredoxin domain
MSKDSLLSRRALLKAGALGTVAAGGAAALRTLNGVAEAQQTVDTTAGRVVVHGSHDAMIAVGNLRPGQLDPSAFLTHFDYGTVSRLPNGQTLREYTLVAEDREIEVAPGVFYPAWTYNGQVPGPTIRCTEGDRIRIHFTNRGSHIHSVHFHGVHPANMDGAFEMIPPGERFVYEFDAEPFG